MRTPDRLTGLAIVLAVFTGLAIAATASGPLPADVAILQLAQDLPFRPIARFFEGPADRYLLPAVALAGVAHALHRRRADLAFLFVVAWSAALINSLVKLAVARPRPAGDFEILSTPDTWSFPSGHAFLAAVVMGAWCIAAVELRSRWLRAAAIAAATLVIIAAGFSRVWLGVHWPSDVLGSWLLAVLVLAVAVTLGQDMARLVTRADLWLRRRVAR